MDIDIEDMMLVTFLVLSKPHDLSMNCFLYRNWKIQHGSKKVREYKPMLLNSENQYWISELNELQQILCESVLSLDNLVVKMKIRTSQDVPFPIYNLMKNLIAKAGQ